MDLTLEANLNYHEVTCRYLNILSAPIPIDLHILPLGNGALFL